MTERVAPPRQLLVDVSVIARHDAGTGIQRVVRAVLESLKALPLSGISICPVAASAQSEYRHLPDGSAATGRPIIVRPGDLFFGLDLAAPVLARHEAQLARWREAGASLHVLLYDMLPIESGHWFRRRTRRNFRRWAGAVERQADQVICISADVAAAFQRWHRHWCRRWLPGAARQITVATVPLSGQIIASGPTGTLPEDAKAILAWMRRRPTVLMVGTVEPRKGYDHALAAFELLWKATGDQAPALLIVGRPGWKTHRLQHRLRRLSSLSGTLLWLDDCSDAFLDRLYASAAGLLFASRGEGFGLPVAEANMRGLPVLARDLPVLREHLGANARVFAGTNARELASPLGSGLADGPPANVGSAAARRSWRDVALDLIETLGLGANLEPASRGSWMDPTAVAKTAWNANQASDITRSADPPAR